MSKKQKQGKCIHCLKWSTQLTNDHVLPRLWYALNVKSNEEKWKAPSCSSCNGKLGAMEKDLFIRLALCLNITNDFTKAVQTKVRDMLNPKLAKNLNEATSRVRKIEELFKDTMPADGTQYGLLPNFNYHERV